MLDREKTNLWWKVPVRYEILQTLKDKIKGDEGNKTAEFKENSDHNDSEEGSEKAGSSDSCCGLEVKVEMKPCVEISSDSECGTPRGRGEVTVASLDALDMLLFPGAGTPTSKRQRFSEKSSPATLPDRCALLDDTAMYNLVNNTSRLHEVRGVQRKQEGQADQEWQQIARHEGHTSGQGSKLHVTDVKIAPYLGIHDVDFVSWRNAYTVESTMRCGASWNPFLLVAHAKAADAEEATLL